ncbi:MAG TPA: hypothetical protein VHX86_10475 [Tepidisphaeraceae bacterium]|jgi:hypothetical protein|nr:hypothetical protein [Tepidisphaeraceae bacterium]
MTSDEQLFLKDPAEVQMPPAPYGILYILRQDIYRCMGLDLKTGKQLPPPDNGLSLWPGAMAIMAGVDLLGKFFSGNDGPRTVSTNFDLFLKECFKLSSQEDRITIYQLRNSLLHSFGLYSEAQGGRIFRFSLNQTGPPITRPIDPLDPAQRYIVNILSLQEEFEKAVKVYTTLLETGRDSTTLHTNFARMFPKYGSIFIGPWPPATSSAGPGQLISGASIQTATLGQSSTYPR